MNRKPQTVSKWDTKLPRNRYRQFLLEQLDDRRMAGSSGEPCVACNQWNPELFGKADVGRVIGGKIVAELPNPGQQHEIGISRNPEVKQVPHGLIGAICRNRSFPHQTPQYLGDLKIQKMRSMQRFPGRIRFDARCAAPQMSEEASPLRRKHPEQSPSLTLVSYQASSIDLRRNRLALM